MPLEKDDVYPDFFDDANYPYEDYDPSWYEKPSAPYMIAMHLARHAAARCLSRAWQRCPDCGRLELVAWRRVGEHEDCMPF